jgi:hypothetical protein
LEISGTRGYDAVAVNIDCVSSLATETPPGATTVVGAIPVGRARTLGSGDDTTADGPNE